MRTKKESSQKPADTLTTAVSVDFASCRQVLEKINQEADLNERAVAAQVRLICREWAEAKGAL